MTQSTSDVVSLQKEALVALDKPKVAVAAFLTKVTPLITLKMNSNNQHNRGFRKKQTRENNIMEAFDEAKTPKDIAVQLPPGI